MAIERAFVISLGFREDRIKAFQSATKELVSIPKIEVWPAVHGDTCQPPDSWLAGAGAWGCMRSHHAIIEYCLNSKVASCLIFEDDARFRPGFDGSFRKFMAGLPSDWQQAYVGGQLQHTHTHPTLKINENVYRPYNVNRTHGYMLSRAGMLPVYRWISDLPYQPREHIDHHLGRWHEDMRNRVYVPPHWLIGQMGDSSNVSGRRDPVSFFTDPIDTAVSHWLYDNPICVLYRGSRDLLQKSRYYLHAGNSIDADGYDVSLALAAKFVDPVPEIDRWYGWIRGEIVRSNSKALPCLYHPRITEEMLKGCGFSYVVLNANTLEDIEEFHAKICA